MKKRVGIIFGGNSVEHEISILSLVQANYAIDPEKYDVVKIYMTKDGHFWVGPNFDNVKTFQSNNIKHYEVTFYNKDKKCMLKGISYLPKEYKKPFDVILPIVHGKNVEDGSLAGYFNILNIAFASCDVMQAAIFQNKYVTKRLLSLDNINVVPYYYFTVSDYKNNEEEVLSKCEDLIYPIIVKPISLGSSVGIKVANNRAELIDAIAYGLKFEDNIIVERKLKNFKEFNQAILEIEDGYQLSEIEEVKSTNSFLTFDDKYLPTTSSREIPAKIDRELEESIESYSRVVANEYQIRGVVRIDYLYDLDIKMLYVNEINTIPGSLAFYLFETNLSFTNLIDQLIEQAIKDKYKNDQKLNSFKSNVLSTTRLLKK